MAAQCWHGSPAAVFLLAPATASAAGLIAAYEEYVTGQGFEIRIVNAATGAQLPVPAGVNTPADELHPALSPDGSSLVFSRMQLQPKLNGDIVPPTTNRNIFWVNRAAGTPQAAGFQATGAVYTSRSPNSTSFATGLFPRATGGPFPEGSMLVATRHDVPVLAEKPVYPRGRPRERRRERRPACGVLPQPLHLADQGLDLPALHGVAHRPLPGAVHA